MGVIVSISITVGGAWLASTAHSKTASEPRAVFEKGVSLVFNNVRNDTGNIVVIVFGDRDAFKAYDVNRAVAYKEVPAKKGSVRVGFPELKSGPYAVAAFHDEDGNQDLTMKSELPAEGYATSRAIDASDRPTFAAASLNKDNSAITMFYLD